MTQEGITRNHAYYMFRQENGFQKKCCLLLFLLCCCYFSATSWDVQIFYSNVRLWSRETDPKWSQTPREIASPLPFSKGPMHHELRCIEMNWNDFVLSVPTSQWPYLLASQLRGLQPCSACGAAVSHRFFWSSACACGDYSQMIVEIVEISGRQ